MDKAALKRSASTLKALLLRATRDDPSLSSFLDDLQPLLDEVLAIEQFSPATSVPGGRFVSEGGLEAHPDLEAAFDGFYEQVMDIADIQVPDPDESA